MMELLWIPAAACAFVSAAWLHELTHAAAVRLLGGDVVDIDFVQLETAFVFEDGAAWKYRLALLAPALVGFAIAPLLFFVWSGSVSIATAVIAISWVIYSLNGGTDGELALAPTKSPIDDHISTKI